MRYYIVLPETRPLYNLALRVCVCVTLIFDKHALYTINSVALNTTVNEPACHQTHQTFAHQWAVISYTRDKADPRKIVTMMIS